MINSKIYSNKPYLLRAFYNWIVDCELTPYVVVDAHVAADSIFELAQYVKKNRLILDISPNAVINLEINNRELYFEATFNGLPVSLNLPIRSVISIYAKENKQGCDFSIEEGDDELPPEKNKTNQEKNGLRLV